MIKIVLATARTHPRLTRSDELLATKLAESGAQVTASPWDTIPVASAHGPLVCVRSTWDYHLRPAEFRRWVEGWQSRPHALWNPPATLLWNLDKVYLRDLSAAGVPIPCTRWFEPGEWPDVDLFLSENGLTTAVIKPRISATAHGTRRVTSAAELASGDEEPLLLTGSLLQAFVPEILTEGELSLVFVRGRFCHAVRKQAAVGEFRVQADFGGRVSLHDATDRQRAFGEAVLALVPHPWLYARVDIVETASGPVLMELELIEPELFLDRAPATAERLAAEILSSAER